MAAGSWRWWFENRETGEITISQSPNWSLWSIGVLYVTRLVLSDGSTPHDAVGWAIRGLWVVWAAAELTQGVNPWRRLLGAAVIIWQIVGIVATIS